VIGVVELEDDADGIGAKRAARVRDRLRADGILLRPLGPVLYLMPPLITPESILRELVAALAAAMRSA